MKLKEYVDYYEKNKIIPVVHLKDLSESELKQQRFAFYFKIGITKNDFLNKQVLELCGGVGVNSYYLLKYTKVKHITIVDNNSSSIKQLKINLKNFNNKKIINKDIRKINLKKKYDYVIIENAISGFENPGKIFNKIYGFLKPGGILVLTLTDEVSILPDKMRFLLSEIIIKNKNLDKQNLISKSNILGKIFHSHLNKLEAKTRDSIKWVQDNLLHSHWIQKNKYFSLLDLFKVIKNKNLIFNNYSPDFTTDYGWYKKFKKNKHNFNIMKNYNRERINFLDYEQKFNSENNIMPKKIIAEIISVNKLFNKMKKKNINKSYILKILRKLDNISSNLNSLEKNNKISLAINNFNKMLRVYFKYKKLNFNKLKVFKNFWGHGAMQISLLKY